MTAIPEVYEALVASWRLIKDDLGLDASQILDGPAVTYLGTQGIAVGATSSDTSAEFSHGPAALDGQSSEHLTIPCLIWAGHGDVTFTPLRDRVRQMLAAVSSDLARDRTIRGTVTAAWITGGVWDQVQTRDDRNNYRGALVTCEFRIESDRF